MPFSSRVFARGTAMRPAEGIGRTAEAAGSILRRGKPACTQPTLSGRRSWFLSNSVTFSSGVLCFPLTTR